MSDLYAKGNTEAIRRYREKGKW